MQATLNPVELLRQYLRNTPAHELAADWAAVDALGIEGPTLSEVLSLSTKFYPVLPPEKHIEQINNELLPQPGGVLFCIRSVSL